MPVSWLIAIILVILYLIWIGYFFYGWLKNPVCSTNSNLREKPYVSLIIPVRNEELNMENILNDLIRQDYPEELFEIIIVDDHSSDLTSVIVDQFRNENGNIRYIRLTDNQTGKKSAIQTGVKESRFPVILTTDADCRLPAEWMAMMVNCFESTGSDLIAGPVILNGGKGFFARFQQLEMFSLIGSTAGAINSGNPVMCSSANLGFKKEAYLKSANPVFDKFSSGDDVFLLHEMDRAGRKISFFKHNSFYVTTEIQSDLRGFLKQRKRWTSKSRHYKSKAALFTAILVFLINVYAVICITGGFLNQDLFMAAGFILFFKSAIDFPFLYSVADFYGSRNLMRYFPAIQIVYFFYISFTVILAFINVNDWKGRIVK
jgi:poly-beta-1,6-N-acetyl-D-glucosamine synthase